MNMRIRVEVSACNWSNRSPTCRFRSPTGCCRSPPSLFSSSIFLYSSQKVSFFSPSFFPLSPKKGGEFNKTLEIISTKLNQLPPNSLHLSLSGELPICHLLLLFLFRVLLSLKLDVFRGFSNFSNFFGLIESKEFDFLLNWWFWTNPLVFMVKRWDFCYFLCE